MKYSGPIKIAILIVAQLFTLKMSVFADKRAHPNHESSYVSILSSDIEDPTTSFILLDKQALDQLGELGAYQSSTSSALAGRIIDYAKQFLGRPYVAGAKGPLAFDCSGFTSFVFKNFNISLSPSSRDQFNQGVKINLSDVKPGDLLFFGGHRGGSTVGHVVMAVSVSPDGIINFIHASNTKGISYGTYPDGGYYSQRYLGARRVLND
jgi:cell wall-associated NlpC family hydrolase